LARSSKDLARRLRFDRFPRPDFFRRRYVLAAAVAAAAGVAAWVGFTAVLKQRQYLPGPVSQSHATFGDRCEKCHSPFRAVANSACLECHSTGKHSQFEIQTPLCRDCHVEHRPVPVSLVGNQACLVCHTQLRTTRPPPPLIQTRIRTFADHPQFLPLRPGRSDRAAVRFNHRIHLTSDKIARDKVGPTGKLECADCHRVDARGMYMQPIVFELHCRRCHEQKPPSPIGGIEAPHKAPEVIRAALTAQLAVLGIQDADTIFKGRESTLPGILGRPPLSQARSLQQFLSEQVSELETSLYRPFDDHAPLLEHNRYCFLCHLQDGEPAPGELPKLKPTHIPHRWLKRAEFSHRRHDMIACRACHDTVEKSERTSDVNLPGKELCMRCHVDARHQSAGTACTLCHLYHDTSKHPELHVATRKEISLGVLSGR
jgi:hypothetical protein